ncbi:DUF2256 domain-containing protein [Pseudomaricurvus sp.]|uniref:DUF2256 domain-containing protein n=1 Tax=Pseudomaricurvus sp. TaxID=2004510 RepID=UPI003F6B49C3
MSHKKPHLPTKICLTCQRNFAWRKKWRKEWVVVKYCSKRCASQRGLKKRFDNQKRCDNKK